MIPAHICERDWEGETAVLVASGPSAASLDPAAIKGCKRIAVMHGYRALPWADVLIASGRLFFKNNDVRSYPCDHIVITRREPNWNWLPYRDPRMVYMERGAPTGLSEDPAVLAGSETSVMLAINYVVLRGVKKVVLLGCDGAPGPNGQRRVGRPERDTHDARARYQRQERMMATQIPHLKRLGVEIVNASPGTHLSVYPRAELAAVL